MTELPVLDLTAFRDDPSSPASEAFISSLVRAAHDIGFVYLTGHGIAPELDAAMFSTAQAFFALPAADRRALAIENSAAFRGYTILGDEVTNGQADWREQIDLGPEQDAPALRPGDPAWLRLRGPNQWPASLPSMAPTVLEWMAAMEAVGLAALRALACGLGLAIDHWDAGFVPESDVHLKIIHYPAPAAAAATQQGVGLHSDTGLLTFILQDDTGGLQVQIGDRMVDATPIPGAYLMNLGEMLETATDGYLKATPHRVVSPPAGSDRLSIAYFFNPRFELPFERIELPARLAADAPGANHDGVGLKVFGENNLKTRLRSHPDVARRHYADLG
ncbi:MAG: 2-oxoglutarate and iron-dependent oxygenase domain-containing protein [Actinomycetota bacterium]